MRIISGIYGRRRFQTPSSFKARPTTDFAKENLFNVLSNIIDFDGLAGLDLFSGTGSIAFELLSRGCTAVTAVEADRSHAAFIANVAAKLQTDKLNLIRGDVFRFLAACPRESFDFIFADPPYDLPELTDVPIKVLTGGILRTGGVFVMEHSKMQDFSALPNFHQKRVYGSVNFSIFVRKGLS
ncbi:MAG: RsmD family RNA methyltransferase [Tannerella sp.]|jgi:16S rRNA (guanine(966)-N(2))-methyltransferase RsmD|nr:RsmD family RNA methyltransferase [Tannerella sp.]